MLIRSQLRKVGHDLDLKIFIPSDISYCKMYVIMNLMHLESQISRLQHAKADYVTLLLIYKF